MFETNSVIYKKYYFNIKYFPNSKKKKSYCPNTEHKKQKKKKDLTINGRTRSKINKHMHTCAHTQTIHNHFANGGKNH